MSGSVSEAIGHRSSRIPRADREQILELKATLDSNEGVQSDSVFIMGRHNDALIRVTPSDIQGSSKVSVDKFSRPVASFANIQL